MSKKYWVYIMTNKRNTVLYTGMTGDLGRRMHEHKSKKLEGFTARYNIDKLVYAECFDDVRYALLAEKKIKAGSRKKKIDLIKSINPDFEELTI
ncbi:MAG TPA: excinuclease ABC subunit C [Candidatus Moranbacteria bacterium]|nr:excinuclease ABC subunit C [Candidatus Moranbacteria bacterium]